ncbi:MAG TPA: multifunctional CCA tRNA nucleotidyl transferase/2'3'-cyclic phosphodiesterase/2'nucleotidase/phosphatase [Steroidobacteraceae bacterium]|nr:multifunctional CCA tRNA nucleotidyl transferase/2'3'-cyclic phosphodiesterase/2'nucleotidase/phosphatase [Steroidobacteraceae bacterium]
MQVYLVGGAVRDELLGLPVRERDWVVVGATPQELERAGYRSVGREFPVFLHPDTHEEYALARLERKVGPGYRGFVTEFSPAVTLEQDLLRRDLTINAMARDATGTLIDPYGGRADLEARLLRHVSPAFAEDPVRILRVARFAARFAPLGFRVAPETLELMRAMVRAGEADALVSERVWRELERALATDDPGRAFQALQDCGALAVLLPELARAADLPAELDALHRATAITTPQGQPDTAARWAALLAALPAGDVEALCGRLRVPAEHRDLALLAARVHAHLASGVDGGARLPTDPDRMLELLELADAWRRPERFGRWLEVWCARAAAEAQPLVAVDQCAARLAAAQRAAAAVQLAAPELAARRGPEIASLLHERRLAALRAL